MNNGLDLLGYDELFEIEKTVYNTQDTLELISFRTDMLRIEQKPVTTLPARAQCRYIRVILPIETIFGRSEENSTRTKLNNITCEFVIADVVP